MANPYELRFSSPLKSEKVIVPDYTSGSGINNYDTSLDLVGAGYPNYGQAFAQNFLKLLENFSSPYPPENAIEGQLWYDTSDEERKVLRINNGTDFSSRWPSANGIYQQTNDPALQYYETVKEGDIWVDTNNSQLKLRYGSNWRLVGPYVSTDSQKTGPEPVSIESSTGLTFPVILNWANGKVVEIISNSAFIPKIVIDGFSSISTGSNLTNKLSARYNGISEKAVGLIQGNSILKSSDFLKSNVSSQIHTGTLIINSTDGIQIKNTNFNNFIKINSDLSGGNVNFTDDTKFFKIGINEVSFIKFDATSGFGKIGVNTSTNSNSPTFYVNGDGKFTSKLTIESTLTQALSIPNGGIYIHGDAVVNQDLTVNSESTLTGRVTIGSSVGSGLILTPSRHDVYDIGTGNKRFRHIYASKFGTTVTNATIFYGNLQGTATKLASQRTFKIEGMVTTTNLATFDGSTNVILTATVTENIILNQIATGNANATSNILLSDSGLFKITKQDFLSDIYNQLIPTGAVLPWTTSSTATLNNRFLLCDGSSYPAVSYSNLYGVIGLTYGSTGGPGYFNVPNYVLPLTTGTFYFIIKT